MQEEEVHWRHVASVTWLIMWRGAAIGFALLLVLFFIRFLAETAGARLPFYENTILNVFGLFLAPVLVHAALLKRYQNFKIVIVKLEPEMVPVQK